MNESRRVAAGKGLLQGLVSLFLLLLILAVAAEVRVAGPLTPGATASACGYDRVTHLVQLDGLVVAERPARITRLAKRPLAGLQHFAGVHRLALRLRLLSPPAATTAGSRGVDCSGGRASSSNGHDVPGSMRNPRLTGSNLERRSSRCRRSSSADRFVQSESNARHCSDLQRGHGCWRSHPTHSSQRCFPRCEPTRGAARTVARACWPVLGRVPVRMLGAGGLRSGSSTGSCR